LLHLHNEQDTPSAKGTWCLERTGAKPYISQKKAKATPLCGEERAQRTHTEEFYEVTDASFELSQLNQALLRWGEGYIILSDPTRRWDTLTHPCF